MEIYRRMYSESKPKRNFDKMMKTGEAKKENFFMYYYLSDERMTQIIKDVCKKNHVYSLERKIVTSSVLLGSSPCGDKEIVNKWRTRRKLRLVK